MFGRKKHKQKQVKKRQAPVIESLEPRILLSADLPGLDVPDADPNFVDDADIDRILAQAEEAFLSAAQAEAEQAAQQNIDPDPVEEPEVALATAEPAEPLRQELVIVDPSVEDYELLLFDMQPVGGDQAGLRIVILDPQRSGVDQISEILSKRSDLDAIHLISHGSDGAIRIGSDTLDLGLLQSEPETFSEWGGALTAEGDILVYGCNVAESEAGQVLIDTLAEMTRADVAASDDLTGHANLGGDWELEYKIGVIETDVVAGANVQQNWSGVLAGIVVDTTDDYVNGDGKYGDTSSVSALLADKGSDGLISLREAIDAANNTANFDVNTPDEISFNISVADSGYVDPDLTPGNGDEYWTISVDASGLPYLLDPVILDATTQPGYSGNPVIELDGSATPPASGINGIALRTDDSTVKGFIVHSFADEGIEIDGSTGFGDNNIIQNNWVGIDAEGNLDPNAEHNVMVSVDAVGNQIGGTGANEGNVIANAQGSFNGLIIRSNSDNNIVEGNLIGVLPDGVTLAGNGGDGIRVELSSDGNRIGGTGAGAGNVIAGNAGNGIDIEGTTDATYTTYVSDTTIIGNTIYGNAGAGIDLNGDGVTANDANDGDSGPNSLQNFPVITQADLVGTNLTVSGTLDTDGLTTQYRIEFFGNVSGTQDPTNGEGRYFLGAITVTTDGSGDASFSGEVLSDVTLNGGDFVTATATRIEDPGQVGVDDLLAYGNTSEFSQNVAITDVNAAPTDVYVTSVTEGGIALNNDGGNDAYFVAADGGGLLGGLTTLTIEASFSVDTPAADNTVLLSYADGANDEELALFLKNDGSIWFHAHSNGSSGQLTTGQYPELLDGKVHHVAVSWDSSTGAVAFYVDGSAVESFTGYQTGQSIAGTGELVLGQDQDFELGGFNTIDVFSGALYDVRIFNDVRTTGEIAASYDQTLPGSEPGMIANWRFEDLSEGGVITEVVAGNNLTLAHVGTGGGFTTSTPGLMLEVAENAVNGTVVGTLATVDSNTGDTFTYTLLDDAGGRFAINSSTGQVTVADTALIDFESATSHNVTVRVTDSGGLTYDEVFAISVLDVNEAAVISGDVSYTGDEGDAVGGTMGATDVDGLTDSTYFTVSSAATNGTAAIDPASGAWTFTPTDPNWFGSDSFEVTVTDDLGGTTTQVVNITLANVDDSATISGDISYTGDEGDAVGGTMGATDVDGLTDSTYFSVSTPAANGTAAINAATGAWTFTPTDPDWFGSDSFEVTVTDDLGGTTTQVVNITLANVDDAAVISGDISYTGDEGDAVTGTLGATDVDGLTDGTYFTVSSAATNGTAAIDPASGAWTFTPTDPNWFGSDSFEVTVTDDLGGTTTQVVNITLANADDGAVISGDVSYTGNEGDAVSGTMAATDVDGLTDGTVFTVTSAATNGTAAIDPASGDWTFTPTDPNWFGSDSFEVTVTDDLGGTTTQVVNITLANVDDGAVITGDISYTGDEGDAVTGTLGATDVDGLTDSTYFTVSTPAANGTAAINAATGAWTFTPTDPDWFGSDSFEVTVTDDLGGTTTQVVSITLANVDDAAVISGDISYTGDEGDAVTGTMGATDVDGLTDGTYFTVSSAATNGTAAIDPASGAWTFTPTDPNWFGSDSFEVTVTDDLGGTTTQIVSITLANVNDGAVISGDISYTGDEGDAVTGTMGATDVDGLTDGTYFTVSSAATNGTAAIDPASGAWTFTPTDPDWFGSDSFEVTVTDDLGGTTTQVVNITLANVDDSATISGDISYTGDEGDAVGGTMGATDVDGLTDSTYFTVSTPATNGTAAINAATGAWTFTPTDPDWFGSDSFEVTVTDDLGGTTTQVVNITLANVDDAAVISGDISYTGDEGDAVTGTMGATDVDGLTDSTYFSVSTPATNGTAAINAATGAWTFTPTDPDWFGSDSFEVTVTDDLGGTTTQVVNITLANVDDAAVISGDISYTGDEGDAVGGTMGATDVDGLTDSTYFSVSTPAASGTAAIDPASGAWTFTPTDPDWFGSDSFEVTVTDDLGGTTTQLVNITLANVDDGAVISGDVSYTGDEGDAVGGTMGATDVDGLTDSTYFTVSSAATNGTAAIDPASGAWTFTPTDPNWFGSDSFEVTVTDDLGGTTTQVVNISLANVDDAAVISGDISYTGDEGDAVTGTMGATDVDGLTDSTYFTVSSAATNGTAAIDPASGAWTFTPTDPNWFGSDSFEVTVTDDLGGTTTQVVSITLANVDDAAVISGDVSYAGNEGDAVSGTMGATDVDGLTDSTYFAVTSAATNGTAAIDPASGAWTFTPTDPNWFGSDSFEVTVTDDLGGTTTQVVNISLANVDDAAVISGDISYTGDEGDAVTGTMGATDVDGLTDSTYFTVSSAATNGTAAIDPASGAWTFTPTDPNWFGSDSFEVTVTDDLGGTTTQVVSITLANVDDAAVISGDVSYAGNEGDAVSGTMGATDVDGLTDSTYFAVTSAATNGTAAIDPASGAWTFTPTDPNWFGSDSFEVTVTDDLGGTTTQVVSITLANVDDAAVISGDISYAGDEGDAVSGTMGATDVDGLTDSTYFTVSTPATNGTAAIDPASGAWTFTPTDPNWFGSDSFEVTVTDDLGGTTTQVVNITLANVDDGAVISGDIGYTGDEGDAVSGTLGATDVDGLTDGTYFTVSGAATNGTAAIDPASGAWTFTPTDPNWFGSDSFEVTVTDDLGGTTTQIVSITLANVDDSAVISGDIGYTGDEGDAVTGTMGATDVDGLTDSTYFTVSTPATNGTAAIDPASGAWTFTPTDPDWFGSDSFEVTVTDDLGGTTTQVVSITLANVDDPAVISGDISYAGDEGDAVSGTMGATDVDGLTDSTYFTVSTPATNGTAAIDPASGAWTFTPTDPNWFGSDSFEVTVTDDLGGTTTQVVNITLANVDDSAVISGDISYTGNEGDSVGGTMGATDVDGLTDGTYFSVTTPATNGTAAIDPASGAWTFTPTDSDWFGSDSFEVTVTDDLGGTTTQVVNITLANVDDAAVISGDISYTGDEGDAVGGTMGATDVDGLTDSTYFSVSTPAASGTAAIDPASGAWTFTPTDPDWFGSDSFEVTVTDDLGGTTTQVVNITLANVDDDAVISGDISYTGDEGDAVTGTMGATDVEGLTDGTYFSVTGAATNGTAAIDPASGAWTFTPTAPDWFGSDSFEVTVTDDLGGTTTQVVNITLANVDDAAVISGDISYTGDEGDAVTGTMGATDVDGLTDSTYFSVSTPATNGTAAINAATGAWTFTPTDPNWFGSDSFEVTVTDDLGGTTTQVVNITLANVDDGAVISGDVSYTGDEGDAVTGTMGATDVDGLTDGTYFTVSAAATNGTANIDPASGAWTFTPTDPNWFGSDSFEVTVTDDLGGITTQIVSITLAPVNDPAVITGDISYTGDEGDAVSGTMGATDVDGLTDGTYFTVSSAATNGTAAIDPASGAWTFTPTDPDWFGSDSFEVTVTDDLGGTTTQVVNITLANVDDSAIISGDISHTGDEGDAVTGTMGATDVDGLTDSTYFTVSAAATNGTANIDPASGAWTFTPTDPNWFGSDSFEVTVTDDLGGSTTQVVNITLANVDDAAVISGDISYTGDEGDAVGGTMGATDVDGLTDSTYFTVSSAATNGTAAIDPASGAWTFTPTDPNWFGSDSFEVTVTDDLGGTTTQVVSITLANVDDAAVISGDVSYTGNEGDAVSGTMGATDVDGLTDSTYFTVSSAATNGTAAIDPASGAWTFTPTDPNWFGSDSFEVTVTDDLGGTTTQVVSITLANVDDPAVISGDISYAGDEGDAVSGTMGATDVDGLTDSTYFSVSTPAASGTAAIDPASGAWTFTPTDPDWFGSDSFEVTVTDDLGGTTTQLVNITLANVDDGAVISGDVSYTGDEGDAVGGTMGATDVDGLTDSTYFTVSTPATNGTAAIDPASGAWTFTPTNPNWFGSDSFEVTVTDDLGGTTTQVVNITLANVDDGAVISGDISYTGDEGDAVSGTLGATDVDGLTDSTYFTVSTPATNGTAAIDPASGAWTFTPTDPNWFGSDSFEVTVTDDLGGTTTQVVNITLANVDDGAVISGDVSYTGDEGDAVTGTMGATDVDGLTDGTYFTVSAAATNGTANIDPASGAWTFTPTDPNWFGSDSFEVTVTDDLGGITTQIVSITLAPVNDPAVITGDISYTGDEGDAVSGTMGATDVDGLTDGTYFTVSSAATNGTAAIDPASGAWTFTPTDPDWFGSDSFEVTVTDDLGGTTTQVVNITLANVDDSAIISGDISYTGDEGDAVTGTMGATDVDGLTDSTYFTVSAAATNGTANIDPASGAWTFTPTDPNWFGSDSFEVTVTDDLGGSTTQVVNITLANVDDAAVISGDISYTGDEGDAVGGTMGATDVDGLTDSTYFTVSSAATNGTAAIDPASGAWTFTPTDPNWFGSDSFEVTVTDDLGGTTTQVVSITLANVDDAAVISGDVSYTGNEGDAVSGTMGATDVDGLTDSTYFTVSSAATNGTAAIDPASGAWTFTPTDPNWFGSDSFEVTVTDDLGGTTTQVVSITLANVDDPAVISGDISYAGDEGDAVSGTMGATDVDGLTDSTYFSVSTPAASGTAAIDPASGAWTFTPTDPDWFGSDSFEVTVTDDLGGTTTQLVNITLANVDDGAVISGDVSYTGDEGDAVGGTMGATDVDGLTDSTYFTVSTPATNGTAAIDPASGAWTFTPTNPNWFGSDSFEVTVTDDLGGTTTQVVNITLANVDDGAVISGDISYTGDEGDAVSGTLGATDVDGLTDSTYFTVSTPATNGTAAIDPASGAWTFTPTDPNWFGSDSFEVTVTDDLGGTTTQVVNITLANVDDGAVISGDVSYTGDEGDAVTGTMGATDVDGLTDGTYFTVSAAATNGTANIDPASGAWTFTPTDPNWFGSDSFEVTVTDDLGGITTQIVSITLAPVNDPAVITGDISYTGDEGDAVSGTMGATDVDGLTDGTYFTVSSAATNGTAAIDPASGAWTFTPTDPDWFGSDSFEVTVTDDLGGTTTQLVNITLANVDDGAVISGDVSYTGDEGDAVGGTMGATDVDGLTDSTYFTVSTPATNGTAAIDPASGAWTFTPTDPNWFGSDSFEVTVTDDVGGTTTQIVNVTLTNVDDPAVIGGDITGSANEGVTVTGTLTATDADGLTDGTYFTITGTLPTNGTAAINASTGAWTFTPTDPDWFGSDSFEVTVTDDVGGTTTQIVNVTLTNVNDAPVIGGVSTGAVTEDLDPDADTLLETTGTLTISDVDPGESSFAAGTVSGSHGYLIIDAAGNWDYVADNTQAAIQQLDVGESVNDILTVTTADGTTHNVTVTINGAEDAPVITGSTSASVTEDGALTATGSLGVTDVDTSDNPISFPDEASTLGDSGYGSFQLSGGAWSYTLNNAHAAVQGLDAGVSLTDSHTFVASDGSTQVVSVVIQGVDESVIVPVVDPPAPQPEPRPEPIETIEPPPVYEAPAEPDPVVEDPEETGRTDPTAKEYLPGLPPSPNTLLGEPLQPDEIFLSVINDIRPERSGVQNSPAAADKPTVETAQTFLQELKSFWKEDSTTASLEMSEVGLSKEFWNDVDRMGQDMEESVEEQEQKMQLTAEAAAGVGISLTAGFVSWALRAGSMAASFLAAMPTWRHFDPMPVLSENKERKPVADADDEDEKPDTRQSDKIVEDLFDR